MPLVHLGAPPDDDRRSTDAGGTQPRRLVLSLAELRALHERLGRPPLPVRLVPDADQTRLTARLGAPPRLVDDATSSGRPAPTAVGVADTTGDVPPALAATVAVLARPEVRVRVQWSVGATAGCGRELHAWLGLLGAFGAALTTVHGTAFELSAFPSGALAHELARVVAPARVAALRGSPTRPAKFVPSAPPVPYELFLAGLRACREGRGAILDLLVEQAQQVHPEAVPDACAVTALVRFLHREERGRLRVTVSKVVADRAEPAVGVVSWVLLSAGWVALEPVADEGEQYVVVRPVEPADLTRAVASMLTSVPS